MAGEPTITVIGNLAGDPELRFTASGHAVANLTIAQTPRYFDKQQNQWVDAETMWVRCTVWREYAENVAESLTKGARVVAYGRLNARSFETKDGQQRTNWEMDVDEIGPSLRWATAQVNRNPRNNNGGGGGGYAPQNGGYGQPAGGGYGQPPAGGGYGQPQNGGFGQPPAGPQGGGNVWNPPPGQNGWDQGQDSPPPF